MPRALSSEGQLACKHGVFERAVGAANIVGCDHLVGWEDGTDLGVERIEGCGGEGLGYGEVCFFGLALFRLDEDVDGDVARVRARPCADLCEAGDERLAVAAVVDVLDVHHLEAGLGHDAVGVKGWVRGEACGSYHLRSEGMSVAAAVGVGEDIEFELAHAALELLGQRWMRVIETCIFFGILLLQELAFAGRDAGVIAVVRADDLDLVHLDGAVR